MEILIATVNIIVLASIAFYLYSKSVLLKIIFWPALIVKLTAGICLGLLYTYYYTAGDTFLFFEDGVALADLAKHHFKDYINFILSADGAHSIIATLNFHQPRAIFLSKIVSVFCLLTANNYWIISIYFSFISFVCAWKLVNTIIYYFPEAQYAAVLSFLFIPSVLFWGSGIIKECLALSALFFLTHFYLKVWFNAKPNLREILIALFLFWILWQLKYYYAAVFIPVAITSLFVKYITSFFPKLKIFTFQIIIWLVVFILPLLLISLSKENFHPDMFFEVIAKNYWEFQKQSKPGGAIQFHNLKANAISMACHAPSALVSGLFRPFIWEVTNFLQVMISAENILLLLLTVIALKNVKRLIHSENRLLLISLAIYSLLLCVFLTLSTPNFGTLARYRIGFLPYLFFLVTLHNPLVMAVTRFLQRKFSHLVR